MCLVGAAAYAAAVAHLGQAVTVINVDISAKERGRLFPYSTVLTKMAGNKTDILLLEVLDDWGEEPCFGTCWLF